MAENRDRKDVPAYKEAFKVIEHYNRMVDADEDNEMGKMDRYEVLSDKFGCSEDSIEEYLKIDSLPDEVQELIKDPEEWSAGVNRVVKESTDMGQNPRSLSVKKASKMARKIGNSAAQNDIKELSIGSDELTSFAAQSIDKSEKDVSTAAKALARKDIAVEQGWDVGDMATITESIASMGVVTPITVREIEDGYEVIAGMRRYTAAMDVMDEDDTIPANVVDADDDEARLIALTENFQRSDLTPVEEANAFAEYVEIEIPEEEAEMMDVEFRVEEDGSGRKRHYINFADYSTHIKGGVDADSAYSVKMPGETSQSVQEASEELPGVTERQIRDRLELLILPDEILREVDDGDMTQSMAREFVDFRKVEDIDADEFLSEVSSNETPTSSVSTSLSVRHMPRVNASLSSIDDLRSRIDDCVSSPAATSSTSSNRSSWPASGMLRIVLSVVSPTLPNISD